MRQPDGSEEHWKPTRAGVETASRHLRGSRTQTETDAQETVELSGARLPAAVVGELQSDYRRVIEFGSACGGRETDNTSPSCPSHW
ncbi:hypothetical protein SKAU_G00307900 [Synaphobranchus kaupii]|uniref:Uncharacterized protein n=1 Tax=Synaphobranchus kaupii TaxID=118154 RepID=A0A9Q1ER37_SYNKA|nr:hypothetical protein SKAU_G00307900 [Synaphobranchus kaupii]